MATTQIGSPLAFLLFRYTVGHSTNRCSIIVYLRRVRNASQPSIELHLNVSVFTPFTFCNLYGIALKSLSICRAVECWIIVLYLSSKVVGIVADFIHLRLPSFPTTRFSPFSFMPSSCCQAFIMRNRSLLLSRLYNPSFFQSFVVIHVFKTFNFNCEMVLNSFYFMDVFFLMWVPY